MLKDDIYLKIQSTNVYISGITAGLNDFFL